MSVIKTKYLQHTGLNLIRLTKKNKLVKKIKLKNNLLEILKAT